MCRTVSVLITVLLVVVGLGSDSPRKYDDRTEIDGIEGTWRLVAMETAGGRESQAPRAAIELTTYRRGRFAWPVGGGNVVGSYWTDTERLPAHLDELPEGGPTKGNMWKNIYEFRGDTLRVAYLPSGVERPKHFDDKGVIVLVFKREKK
jgi:uncharacterized protein (TIGR03067 family)